MYPPTPLGSTRRLGFYLPLPLRPSRRPVPLLSPCAVRCLRFLLQSCTFHAKLMTTKSPNLSYKPTTRGSKPSAISKNIDFPQVFCIFCNNYFHAVFL